MSRVFCSFVVVCAVLSAAGIAWAQSPFPNEQRAPWGLGQSRGEDLEITLVTFGPGPSVESWFGHTALVVEDRRLGQRRLYNYGMFNFGPDMLPKFAMGRLEFWVEDTPYVVQTYRMYTRDQRDVILQKLNLSPEQRASLAKALDDNVQPANRDYLYHHYNDNCSTRPRDRIDDAVHGQLKTLAAQPARLTLRGHTRRHSHYFPPMSVLLDFLMNDEIDRPITQWEEAFLPGELERQLDRAQITSADGQKVPLVAQKTVFFDGSRPNPPEEPPSYGVALLSIGALLGGIAALLAWWFRRSGKRLARVLLGFHHVLVGLLFGLPGTVLMLMWLFTEHTVTHRNENLLLANPLTLAAVPLGIMMMFGSARGSRGLRWVWLVLAASGLLSVVIKVLPLFDQDNWRIILLVLPASLGMAGSMLMYEAGRQRAAIPVAPAAR